MKFMSTQADPDVWIWNAGTHYNMVLVYFDDILVFAKEPRVTMDKLGNCTSSNLRVSTNQMSTSEKIWKRYNCRVAGLNGL
jgi:hypothetical protein